MSDIAVCSECEGEMDVSSAAPFDRVACPNCGEEVRVKVHFGNYLLQKRLAYGGMSVLFVAEDQTLGREVALKVLNEDYSSDEFRTAQFEKEAELTALVSHPNVVKVYSVGRGFDRFYIAMELIAGKHLESRLQGGRGMPEKEVLEIALQVVAGLRAAKFSGLIHRDIKPGNILVDDDGVVKIVDFGLSLMTQGGSAKAEEIFTTPYYAPPEALEAKVEDFRSDIYALGATLYHALAGRPPIESSSVEPKVLLEIKRKVPRLRKVTPTVSASTESLVARMMAFDKENRCESYEEVKSGLELALKGEGQVRPGSEHGRARSRQLGAGVKWAIGLGAVGLVALGGLVLSQKDEAGDEGRGAGETLVDIAPGSSDEFDESSLIGNTYQQARMLLQKGKLAQAESNYLELYRQENVPEPTRSWAGFEAGLCALLDGRSGDARVVFGQLQKSLEGAELDERTRSLLQELVSGWDSLGLLSVSETCPTEPDEAMVEFAKAVGNWERGQRDMVSFFDSVVAQEFGDKKEWLASYQEWAAKLSHDAHLLKDSEPLWTKRRTRKESQVELAKLRTLKGQLQTRGRAVFIVSSWEQWFEGGERKTQSRSPR